MALSADHVADLVVSALATHQYPLDKAWELKGSLKVSPVPTTRPTSGETRG